MHLYAKNNADSYTSNVHLKNENENIAKPQKLTVQIRHNLSSWGDFSSFFLLYGGQPSFLFFFLNVLNGFNWIGALEKKHMLTNPSNSSQAYNSF